MESEKQKAIHVLMVSIAFQGHLNPTLRFAKRLVSKGLHVTLASTEEARHRFLNNHDNNIQFEFFSDGLPPDFDRTRLASTFLHSLETTGAQNLSNLITQLRPKRTFSCVIITPLLSWASQVASSHKIPCAILWFQASSLFSIYYRYACETHRFPNLENLNQKFELPALPVLEVRDLPDFILPSSPDHHKKLVWDLSRVLGLGLVKWVLGSSFLELEEEVVKSMKDLTPILPIGPLVSPFLLGESEEERNVSNSCLEWLNNKPRLSVIYVAFGSLMVLSQKQIDNIGLALKNTKRPFLWVIRPKGGGLGGGELPRGFLEETEGRGHVVTWSPQEKVLMHPSVGCFVSHCGWNSTVEAVAAGVPVIGHPNWSDQATNAKLVADVFGNGVRMRIGGNDEVVEVDEVERCVWEVMEGPKAGEIRKRAMELKAAARKALQYGGSSDANINRFVSEIVGKSG